MTDTEAFELTFIAVSYLLGRREALVDGLANAGPSAQELVSRLSDARRDARAKELARALRLVVADLDARRCA